MTRTGLLTTAAAAALAASVLAVPAAAQQQQERQQPTLPQTTPGQPQAAQAEQARPTAVSLQGRIEKMKDVQVRGTDRRNRVVLLRTERGSDFVVDLGPAPQLADVQLQQGQQIAVQGDRGRIGDRLVLFAEQIRADGRSVRIERPDATGQTGAQARTQAQAEPGPLPENRQVRGEIVNVKEANVVGAGQPNLLALIRTRPGGFVVADLGQADAFQGQRPQQGQQIMARGEDVRAGDRIVLMADAVRLQDRTIDVQRPARSFQAMEMRRQPQQAETPPGQPPQGQPPQGQPPRR